MRPLLVAGLLPALLTAPACAPRRLLEGVGYVADRWNVRDAASLRVARRGHLRFDIPLRSELDEAIAQQERDALIERGADVLARAHGLALRAVAGELERMPPAGLALLIRDYALAGAPPADAARREFIKRAFAARARRALEDDLARLRAAPDSATARAVLKGIRRGIEPPAGERGKLGRVLLAAPFFLPVSLGLEIADAEATQRSAVIDFDQVVEYRPAEALEAGSAAELEQADIASLARWFAPIFVQQNDPGASYPASDDRIGRVYLSGSPARIEVQVDVARPAVYWTHRQARLAGRKYDQLVYVAWYPSRPALKPADPAAGRVDGIVLRITLDRHRRPAIYEFVRSCGCYHTLWVAEFVEAAARQEYGPPVGRQRYAVQPPTSGRGLFLAELVPDDGARPHRPFAYISAGKHFVMGVRPAVGPPLEAPVVARYSYRLLPYESLTRMPLGDAVASMFGSDGLVHNAGRGEGWLLAPSGLLSAGQPRQLDTMKIRLDAYDYDDPRLLERHLRLPSGF